MLRYKVARQTKDLIFWDVKIAWHPRASVKEYIKEIKYASPIQKGDHPVKIIWVYSSGAIVGYVKFFNNKDSEFYNKKNLDVWDAIVAKCELVACQTEYLYRIWTKEEEAEYERMRPIVPEMLLSTCAIMR